MGRCVETKFVPQLEAAKFKCEEGKEVLQYKETAGNAVIESEKREAVEGKYDKLELDGGRNKVPKKKDKNQKDLNLQDDTNLSMTLGQQVCKEQQKPKKK